MAADGDRARGIIYVEGKGLWTMDMVGRHFDNLAVLAEQFRAQFGRARVFVDTREAVAQPADVEALLRARIAALYDESDRVATLVAVDLRRISVSPRVSAGNRRLFDDPMAAIRWLAKG
ncbi:hypothetical protein LWE61_18340 [Sphingobium sufflavum]|uniref:hypothetical protein n=1 Tax=Sphingobium sufflavum TaxID=1129547 RepID=UPI001F2EAB4E|nr:hypothetical protein [Sphingobium sufflavum]MCE7798500.1 hypothetical protein [Sphingobium sufflavum]